MPFAPRERDTHNAEPRESQAQPKTGTHHSDASSDESSTSSNYVPAGFPKGRQCKREKVEGSVEAREEKRRRPEVYVTVHAAGIGGLWSALTMNPGAAYSRKCGKRGCTFRWESCPPPPPLL